MDKFVVSSKRRKVNQEQDELHDKVVIVSPDWKSISRPQLRIRLCQLVPPRSRQSRDLYERLEEQVEYLSAEESRVKVFNKWHAIPRKQAGYGEEGFTYQFSGQTLSAKPWCPVLAELRGLVSKAVFPDDDKGEYFNFVLVNRYADGRDYAGEHRDDERDLDPAAPIASLSLGAERDFYFKHGLKRSKSNNSNEKKNLQAIPEDVRLSLKDGMLLLMEPPTNRHWYHGLPVRKRCLDTRINLTFRRILHKN